MKMKWNERRLQDFYKMNFDNKTCNCQIKNEMMIVTDEKESITFVIKDNKIYSPDTEKYYM